MSAIDNFRPVNSARLVALIKTLHTIIFLGLLVCVLDVTQAAMRGRFDRRSQIALGAIAIEAAIFGLNGRKCPLTELVEDLGAEKGQVSDIFLPDILARNIFAISSALLGTSATVALARKLKSRTRSTRTDHTIPE